MQYKVIDLHSSSQFTSLTSVLYAHLNGFEL